MSDSGVEEPKQELQRAGLGGAAAAGAVSAMLHRPEADKQHADVQVHICVYVDGEEGSDSIDRSNSLESTLWTYVHTCAQAQQLAEQAGARATETRKAYNNDPVRQPGLGKTVGSQHAQYGSHGLHGQGPK